MMRRLFLSILVSAVCSTMQAAEVNQQKAQETAKAFMTRIMAADEQAGTRRAKDGISLKTVETGLNGLHVFNMDGGNGFVIVSGSDQTEAVLGYATEGSIDGEMPPAMRALLQSYAAQITRAEQDADKAEGKTTGIYLTKQEVAPLIKSKWGQDAPYNNMTPTIQTKDKKTIHCPTGCVATAAAMVMRYYEWPKQPTSVIPASPNLPELPAKTFDWAAMRDTYDKNSPKEACDAVATLMKYCGGAFKMQYYEEVASSNTSNAAYGLIRFFGYDSQSIRMMRRTLVTEWEWQNMIYEELAEKRPVIAGGDGHEVIIDGYRQGDFFHINWGWKGGSDGYFQLSVRAHFNAAQQVMKHFPYEIITGIKPTKEPFTYQETLTTTGLTVNTNTPLKLERTADSNFPPVNTILSVRNICRDMENKMFDFGIGIYNGKELEKVFVVANNLEFANEGYIDNIDVGLKFGEGMADGLYQLYGVSKLHDATEWLKNQDVEPWYIDANIAGNTMTLTTHPRDHRLMINSIKYSGDLTEGGQVTAVANITNGSNYDFDGVIILVYDTSDGQKRKNRVLSETFHNIAAGKTEDVTFKFTASSAQTYQTYILYESFMLGKGEPLVIKEAGSSEENVGDYVQLDKTMTMKNAKITGKDNQGSDNYDLTGRVLDITVTLKNTDDKITYKGEVSTIVYMRDPVTDISDVVANLSKKDVTVAPGQSTDVSFRYNNMKPHNDYYLNVHASYFDDLNSDEKGLYPNIVTVPGINVFKTDRSVESQSPAATFTVPADAIAVELNGCGVTTLTPNEQPNCLYYLNDTDTKPATLEGRNVVIQSKDGSMAETLTLKDGYGFMAPNAFVASNVSYTRTFTEAEHQGYTTLVLPFDVQRQEAGGEAFTIQLQELLGDQSGKVYVGHSDELPMAAKPYLLRLKADAPLKNPVTFTAKDAIITDSIATAAAGLYYFQGSFSKRQLTGEECFGFADGKSDTVVPITDNCSPFRAYFQAIGMPTNFESLAIDDQTLDPTGIKTVRSKADEGNEEKAYNLSGQRVSGAYKGIIIKNGIKVVK